jgi:SPP1 family predicted phage head-tail adaptor
MPRSTKAAEFNTKIRVYQQDSTATPNTDGQIPETESLFIERWAKLTPTRGMERFLAQQNQADVLYRVRVHYDRRTTEITPKMWIRIVDADTTRLNIARIYDPDGKRRELELECTRRI